ncbi:MAG: PilZ domain-containing protein, partial [Acidobacteriota bacterium]|nr:PilZ domain-containing protein [Acidobacteriota bacterium]
APNPEDDAVQAPIGGKDPRLLLNLSVRFGEEKATTSAVTSDLSKNGLFVATDKPLPKATTVKLLVELYEFTIPLVGKVVWSTPHKRGSKPAGMGVQLISPPTMYLRHVRQLSKESETS